MRKVLKILDEFLNEKVFGRMIFEDEKTVVHSRNAHSCGFSLSHEKDFCLLRWK